jgi:CheY-like chemotaxis protein
MPQGRILIVDDDPEWIEILTDLLAPFEEQGVLVDFASSRAEAEGKLDCQRFDLVTMDIQLDRPTDSAEGTEKEKVSVKEELKWESLLEGCLRKQTHVIVVSAYRTDERTRRAFKYYKVHDFFEKTSLDRREFIESVEEVLKSVLKTEEAEEEMSDLSHRVGATVNNEIKTLRERLEIHRKNLNRLKKKKAFYGELAAPLDLLNEIDIEEEKIERLEAELCKLKKAPDLTDSD